ncbi:hypothetical protein EDC04DRAFT_2948522 [Pisolithus marmoratus]|nr:hypothetical protein EDC04DRAFT_2948522 [Pisolithus marmoratus]
MSTTTSSTANSNPSSNDALSVRLTEGIAKDVRAHEHARHRAKQQQEHAQAKERKERAAVLRALGFKASASSGGHGGKPAAVRRLTMDPSWDGDEPDVSPWTKPSCVPLEPVAAPLRSGAGPLTELTLADLISVPRPQKKGKHSDFEVIPPVRAVIALDDDTDDTESDEPWEYVTRASLNNEFPRRGGLMHKLLPSNYWRRLRGR